jgi:hypothetical protein
VVDDVVGVDVDEVIAPLTPIIAMTAPNAVAARSPRADCRLVMATSAECL